jgi:hypothetical protein
MTNRFYSPFQQFFDSTPTPRSGARLFFYAAGTSTKQNTYSNTTLVTANDNPLTLNALGQPDTDIYLSDLPIKLSSRLPALTIRRTLRSGPPTIFTSRPRPRSSIQDQAIRMAL